MLRNINETHFFLVQKIKKYIVGYDKRPELIIIKSFINVAFSFCLNKNGSKHNRISKVSFILNQCKISELQFDQDDFQTGQFVNKRYRKGFRRRGRRNRR